MLSLVMSQNFFDPTGSSWDGQYCQDIPLVVTSLARANGNTFFDGNGERLVSGGWPFGSDVADAKYAAYVAPFTVMAFSAKAATASGPGRHNTPAREVWWTSVEMSLDAADVGACAPGLRFWFDRLVRISGFLFYP